jgi:hypothetical protein
MSNLAAKRYAFGSCVEQKTMGQRKVIRTTLGELVVAVTDEVMPIIRDPLGLYRVVSFILSHLLTYHQVRVHKRSLRKYPGYLVEE